MKIINGDITWADRYRIFCQPVYQNAYAAPELGIPAEVFSQEEFNDESTKAYFRAFFVKNKTWLAVDGQQNILGGVGASDTQPVHLSGYYVAIDKQGQGIGRLLFDEVLKFAHGREIELDVMRHRIASIGFYKRLGFEIDESVPPLVYGWQYPTEEGRMNGSGIVMRRKSS